MLAKLMLRTAVLLGLFAIIGTALVSLTFENTREQIAESEKQYLLKSLHELIPPEIHDNDIFSDTLQVTSPKLLGTSEPMTVYRARSAGQPVAAVLTCIAPDGYGGAIRLLVAIDYDGIIIGVRVINHRETPGLGDAIEARRNDWILGFNKRSLEDPAAGGWAVKRDGGVFDQLTGATITPRAVIKAVHKSLQYFAKHRDELFTPAVTRE
jgi:electron transport complex protein RnfG